LIIGQERCKRRHGMGRANALKSDAGGVLFARVTVGTEHLDESLFLDCGCGVQWREKMRGEDGQGEDDE
jgi:hypothetical protein